MLVCISHHYKNLNSSPITRDIRPDVEALVSLHDRVLDGLLLTPHEHQHPQNASLSIEKSKLKS